MNYSEFLESKQRKPQSFGFEPSDLNENLFDWQKRVVEWAVRRGRAALFAECGLGKTIMQLEWARQVCRQSGGNVMIHCPVGVRSQTVLEAGKFSIDCPVNSRDSQSEVTGGITIANYEKLHHFDSSKFVGVVLDESSILKNYTGETKKTLIETWKSTRFKLACTATPAPNDYMELGNHGEFLGVMPSNEMLSRWFINDTMKAGGYRLKGHAVNDFWEWMASWSACITRPSDVGGSDDGFILPELIETVHTITEPIRPSNGQLFDNFDLNATNVHRQKKKTTDLRVSKVGELLTDDSWLIWCNTNYEADALKSLGIAEVRGSDSDKKKAEVFQGFSDGSIKRLITKPSIAGFGMNWQHCNNMAFVGLSYSFEEYYQAVRRCWRFGQLNPVNVHIVETDGETALRKAIIEKRRQFQQMQEGMSSAVKGLRLDPELTRETYNPTKEMEIPKWLNA